MQIRAAMVTMAAALASVASANRGRGDVIYKSALRVVGAVVGTVIATLLSNSFAPGDKWAVVAIFAVLAVALWLRSQNYAYWAGGITRRPPRGGHHGTEGAGRSSVVRWIEACLRR